MVIIKGNNQPLYRYDPPTITDLIVNGNVRISTLKACREAENIAARDESEGHKTYTSLPGRNSLDVDGFAKLFGVNPSGIKISGANAVVTEGENAVRRSESINNAFVFCMSTLANDHFMRSRFGAGCIMISDPRTLFTILDKAIREIYPRTNIGPCVLDTVEYTSRTNNYLDHTNKHCAFIKPKGEPDLFEKECEVRALWTIQQHEIEPLNLQIPQIRELLLKL